MRTQTFNRATCAQKSNLSKGRDQFLDEHAQKKRKNGKSNSFDLWIFNQDFIQGTFSLPYLEFYSYIIEILNSAYYNFKKNIMTKIFYFIFRHRWLSRIPVPSGSDPFRLLAYCFLFFCRDSAVFIFPTILADFQDSIKIGTLSLPLWESYIYSSCPLCPLTLV